MRIPEDKIEEIRSVTDIVEIVGEYVRLKRRGGNYVGLCPFHKEKTPSFNVNPEIGIFKCFGCGVGGNSFQFLMQIENMGFVEAVRLLAERTGIALPETQEERHEQSEVESIYHTLRFAGRFFYNRLTAEKDGEPALEYLERRGFSAATIKKFGLGYAPAGWDTLIKAAEAEPIKVEMLEKAGLAIPKKDKSGFYDRYRDRVVFPIFSHVGKVIGFGGRILKPDENQPKYINSPETRVYHKSRVLYGLFQAKRAIRKREEILLVEGYTDVISLHQAGVEHAVATSGTALTGQQIELIKRYAQRVLVLYDADSAGANAALRGIDLLLEQGLTVYGLELPEGQDPDSFVLEHGGIAFEEYIEKNRKDFVEFIYHLARKGGQLNTPEGQGHVTRSIVGTIARMPDSTMHEPFIRQASHVLGVPDIPLFEALSEFLRERKREKAPPQDFLPEVFNASALQVESQSDYQDEIRHVTQEPLPEEKMLLRLMLDHGKPLVEFIMGNMAVEEFTTGAMCEAVEAVLSQYQAGKIDRQKLIDGSFGESVQSLVTDVLMDQHEPSKNWERRKNINVPRFNEDPVESAADSMTQLKLDRVEEALVSLKKRIYQAQQENRDVRPLLQERINLRALQQQIRQREFIVWNS